MNSKRKASCQGIDRVFAEVSSDPATRYDRALIAVHRFVQCWLFAFRCSCYQLANVFFCQTTSSLQPPAPGMSDKQNDRLEKLLQAAREKLSAEDVEMLEEKKQLLLEKELLVPSAIELATVEQLVGFGLTPGIALLLKKAFPSKLFEWSCLPSHSPCNAPTMSVTV
jgi:hypothetical protein